MVEDDGAIDRGRDASGGSGESLEGRLLRRKWWLSGGGLVVAAVVAVVAVLLSTGSPAPKVSTTGNRGGSAEGTGATGTQTGSIAKSGGGGKHVGSFNPNLPVPSGDQAVSLAQAQSMLAAFQSAGQSATYLAGYVESGGANGRTSFTVAQAPPRSLMSLAEQSQSGVNAEVIDNGSGTYNCFVRTTAGPLPQASGALTTVPAGKGMCMVSPPTSSPSSGTTNLTASFGSMFTTVVQHMKSLAAKDPKITGLIDKSTMTVLNMTVQCLDAPVVGMTFCWTPQGALAYVRTVPAKSGQYGSLNLKISPGSGKSSTSTSKVSITLTSYTTSVPASEFNLPGPVVTLPAGSSGAPSGG